MAIANNPFSMSNMFEALQNLRFSKEISGSVPPPGFTPRASSVVTDTRLDSLFGLMTSNEGLTQFKATISKLNRRELLVMSSLLTSDSGYFTAIVRNKNGSIRVQKLLGKSDDMDGFLCAAILRCFLKIMTDKYASYVAVRAMLVCDNDKKKTMYELTLRYGLDIARNSHGCIAFNEVITDLDDPYYRNELLGFVVGNAVCLSNDVSGNFVVQHVLKLNDLRCTYNVAVNLHGHCVDLSLKKYGSYIVENLLEAAEESMVVVVVELLRCDGDRLMRLARHEFGNFVVAKALRVTKERSRVDLFLGLVHKLMPFVKLLRRSPGSNIANILDSVLVSK
ncbi:hypothetical protein AALP_AA8G397500 [Arabis alpina]|uniref:PUM-HD domain-containing protein n=1 Tax=Arabis alpina TaxID=50452 RepID=A0A087GCE3_ARAAL|nr:hypothetical protein AALP_AA8G397500 [Arabis alpina]